MPVENEFKYVLHDPDGNLEVTLKSLCDESIILGQFYLSPGVRVRSERFLKSGERVFKLAYKAKIEEDKIEIETKIDEKDFMRLSGSAISSLTKLRYVLSDGDEHWDVDFFGGSDKPYFIMAECEVDASVKTMPSPLECLKKNVIYYAGKEKGFSSRKLCDIQYASLLWKRLKREFKEKRNEDLQFFNV